MATRPGPAEPKSRGWRDPVVLAATAALALQLLLVWTPDIPLGVPGEWTWSRIPYDAGSVAAVALGTIVAAPVAAAYLLLCRFGDPGDAGREPPRMAGRLAALAALGFAWLWVVQESGPREIDALGRSPLVLFYPSHSGYFTEARRASDLGGYLASYESLMAEEDVLHIGTHPPGLIVGQRVLLNLFESNPRLTRVVLATRPQSVVATTNVLVETGTGRPAGDVDRPPSPAEQAELWAAALIVQAAAASCVAPLYFLASRSTSPSAAWRAACLWPLVPALAVFLPKSDALLPLFGLSVLALWHGPGPTGGLRAAAAGAIFWTGMMTSLAMLPVAALAGVLSLGRVMAAEPVARTRIAIGTLRATAVAAVTFLGLTLLAYALFDLNLLAVWSWNYRNHAGFYSQYDRTYWSWLLVNPIELTFAVGAPAAAACVAQLCGRLTIDKLAPLSAVAVIGLLWVSGKNSGEAARLWLILMPWILWAGAGLWSGALGRCRWSAVLPLQMAVGFLTAVRVAGFGFDEFIASGG